ncbi:membrane integrity-associated transporter subunit PqiC [Solimonas sp. K1W22B-7]|uniref:PqiC family protein n=1 Tax=Solimonas sp. K1W22B-7 TaxID=2303331 RepID=UPI000E335E22|nr:PqiC family protein [Solimonas sp. K1W22B-7]AXQ29583.1 membrane integrity-associated transporter subunit PqiC [Solimonas sp. K1W22B-7]
MKNCVLLLSVLLLAACASAAPLRYYTLAAPQAAAAVPASRWIDVLPVSVPAQVDTPLLVVRQGDERLVLLEQQQWAAPLDTEIRGALVAALAVQGIRDVHALPAPADATPQRFKLDVQAFETVPGRAVRWEAVWSLRGGAGGKAAALTCAFAGQEPVGGEAAELVAGHQRLLRRLAAQVAAALAPGAAPGCPG